MSHVNGSWSPVLGRTSEEHCRLLERISPFLFEDIRCDLEELAGTLQNHPRLMFVVSHGGMISWAPAYVALMLQVNRLAPGRRATGTFHKIMWKIPGLREVAQFVSGADRHYPYAELLQALQSGNCDFWAFPESDSSMFGSLDQVKPFRFHRFIELALEAGLPMVLVVHRGSEPWYRQLAVGPSLLDLLQLAPPSLFSLFELERDVTLRLLESGRLNLPLPGQRLRMSLKVKEYVPSLSGRGLSTDRDRRRAELREEGFRMRNELQELYSSLP